MRSADRLLSGQLGLKAGGVPVLPGFDKAAAFDADDGSAGDVKRLAGGFVAHVGGPMAADQVIFGENDEGSDVEVVELCAKIVVEGGELVGAAEVLCAIVENTVLVQEFEDGVAVTVIPDFFEPADDELFVALKKGEGLIGGGHGMPPAKLSREYIGSGGEGLLGSGERGSASRVPATRSADG